MIKFALGGIPVSDQTLAVEDIAQVGAFGETLPDDVAAKIRSIVVGAEKELG